MRPNQWDCLMSDFYINSLSEAKFSLTDYGQITFKQQGIFFICFGMQINIDKI